MNGRLSAAAVPYPRIGTQKATLLAATGATKPIANILESVASYGRKQQEIAITRAFCFDFGQDQGDLLSFRRWAVSTNQTDKVRYMKVRRST
jgi:hypothetical protein